MIAGGSRDDADAEEWLANGLASLCEKGCGMRWGDAPTDVKNPERAEKNLLAWDAPKSSAQQITESCQGAAPFPYCRSLRITSAAFSATAYTVAIIFPLGMTGNTLASTTRTFPVPYTLNSASTTPPIRSGSMAHVPQG